MLRHKKKESSNSKTTTLEIEQNEYVMTVCNLLECVYEKYRYSIPKELAVLLKDTYDKFLAETTKNYIPEVDIVDSNLYEKVEFKLDNENS